MTDRIVTVDKTMLGEKIGVLSDYDRTLISEHLKKILALSFSRHPLCLSDFSWRAQDVVVFCFPFFPPDSLSGYWWPQCVCQLLIFPASGRITNPPLWPPADEHTGTIAPTYAWLQFPCHTNVVAWSPVRNGMFTLCGQLFLALLAGFPIHALRLRWWTHAPSPAPGEQKEQGSSDRVLLQLTTGYVYDIRNDQIRKFLDKNWR